MKPIIDIRNRLNCIQYKLEFLATLMSVAVGEDEGNINFSHPANINGLCCSLTGIADEIGAASDGLANLN